MGGECGVESEPGFGSTFWLSVPLGRCEGAPAEALPAAAGGGPPGGQPAPDRGDIEWKAAWRAGQRILVAEDNRVNQKMASMLLAKAGWEHEIAADGGRALELLSARRFDLVLMDCQMPGVDGCEATRQIRTRERETGEHLPIVALTANALAGDREACLEAGMDDFIAKPFTAATLIGTLDRWLGPRAGAPGFPGLPPPAPVPGADTDGRGPLRPPAREAPWTCDLDRPPRSDAAATGAGPSGTKARSP
jgi:hypothetical protein